MGKRVPPVGPKDAKLVVVGESPGPHELRLGKPFVGPAGEQLDTMFNASGISRPSVWLTNVLKWQPEGPKEEWFFKDGNPTQAYMRGILELLDELKEVRPNVAVPLGNYALWALTQKSGISKWRGSIIESTLLPGLKVVPTYHPAFYLHQGHFNSHKEALGVWDLTRAAEESRSSELVLPSPHYVLSPTPDEVEAAVNRLLHADHMTVDTEWYAPNDLAYVGFADCPDWAICIPASSQGNLRAIRLLLSSDVPKILQNAVFDCVALSRIGINVQAVKHDTMIEWHCCWGDLREKSLQVITSVLTRRPYYKSDLEYVGQDIRGQRYNCDDCVGTDEGHQKMQSDELDLAYARRSYDISLAGLSIFTEAAKRGIQADVEKMESLAKGYLEKADIIEDTVSEIVGATVNCRSAPQVAHIVYDLMGLGKIRKRRSTRQEHLMDIAASTSDKQLKVLLTSIVRVRQNRNMVSRYLRPKTAVDEDGRIRTNWNLAGTRNGRYSTTMFGRGENPWFPSVAMQTVPDDARECFIADPGCVFVGWDLEQAEARVVAIKTHDFDLIQDMESGVDIHIKLAAMLPFGMTYEEILAKCDEVGKDRVPQRFISKKSRHAFNYMMGSGTFRMTVNRDYLDTGVGIDQATARSIGKAYINLHDGLPIWWKDVRSAANKSPRILENAHGRVRQFLGHFTEDLWRDMIAFYPQSTVADSTTLSIVEADEEIKRLDPQAQFFCHLHDGGFVQVKEECKDGVVEIIKRRMTRTIIVDRTELTIPCAVKVGYNWKDLEPVP